MEFATTALPFQSTYELIRQCRITIAEAQLACQLARIARSETAELLALMRDKLAQLQALSRRPLMPF